MAKVLVIDDDSNFRGIIERIILRSYTYSVRSVAGEEEAWEELSKRPYDLVLLDLYLEGKKSWDTLKRIQALPDAPVVIVISCEDLSENAEYARILGAADFVPKPIDFGRLKYSVDSALERRNERRFGRRAGDVAGAGGGEESLRLLVFADRESRAETMGALSSSRFRLFETEDPGSAAEAIRKERLDAVLTRMDRYAGPAAQLLASLREENPETLRIPVIAITDADPDRILAALKAGADDYLSGPFDPRILAAKVAAHVRIRREYQLGLREAEAGAVTDAITGSYTSAYVRHRLNEEFARSSRYKRNLALGLLTLNHLETLRTRHGAGTVHRVLSEVSRLLRCALRCSDIVGRFGEHDFAMLFPEATAARITPRAERIRANVEECVSRLVDRTTDVSCSIGLVSVQGDPREGGGSGRAGTAEEMLGMAGVALRCATEADRGRLEVFRGGPSGK